MQLVGTEIIPKSKRSPKTKASQTMRANIWDSHFFEKNVVIGK